MKMEISLQAPCDGIIEKLLCTEGQSVSAGQALVLMR
jgi:urea carboxylase